MFTFWRDLTQLMDESGVTGLWSAGWWLPYIEICLVLFSLSLLQSKRTFEVEERV